MAERARLQPVDRLLETAGLPSGNQILCARLNRELEKISDEQHALARRRTALQEAATRLRLGAQADVVLAGLRSVGVNIK